VRYLRCAFSWNGIEPERGRYRFQFWDILVREAARAHITLIPYVAYTPRWAAATDVDFWKQPPANPDDYAGFMSKLAFAIAEGFAIGSCGTSQTTANTGLAHQISSPGL
jgi:hypothetical protein